MTVLLEAAASATARWSTALRSAEAPWCRINAVLMDEVELGDESVVGALCF